MNIKNIFFDKKLISTVIVFIVLLVLLSVIYFFFNKKTQIPSKVYKGSTFEITVPDGWSVATSSIYQDFTVIRENKKKRVAKEILKINEPMVFIVSHDAGTTTLDSFASEISHRLIPTQLRGQTMNYKIIENSTTTLSGKTPAYMIGTYFETTNNQTRNINDIINAKKIATPAPAEAKISKYKNLSLITIKNGKIYIVTATSPEDKWPQFDNKFREILLNFNPI